MTTKNYLILSLLFLLLPLTAYAQINVRDSLQTILTNDTIKHEDRFINAYNLIFLNSSPEEAEALAMNVVYPFVKKTWNTESEQLAHLSRLYLMVSYCYRERGGDNRNEMERRFAEKALDTALESGNDMACARAYMSGAFMEIKRGDTKQAHEYLYDAIHYYDKMGMYVNSSEMLYVILGSFFDIEDTEGLKRVLGQMEENLKKDSSKQSQYQYNVGKHSYFDLLLEKEKADKGAINYQLVDSVMLYTKKNIDLVENHLKDLNKNWMHGYAYFFLAKALDAYLPEENQQIFENLDKAEYLMNYEWHSFNNEANAVMELQAYIAQFRARALFREGKSREAYTEMSEALRLLDELKGYKNLSVSRNLAFEFMVEYYEKTHQPAQALKYMRLLHENDIERFENEKVQAINDMSAKYETEKKEIRIQNLVKENITARRILWLTIAMSLALLATFFFVILFSRQKNKNTEQELYETALLAELRQNELEKVQTLQQQLEQSPVNSIIENIGQMVSASLIGKEDKKAYLDRLSKLDPKLLEQVHHSSKAKITGMDMKYIICFSADFDVRDISLLFNIEPASVHTVRYRIKKKLPKETAFRVTL